MSSLAVNFLLLMYPQGPWCLAAATPERDKLEVRTFIDPDLAKQWIETWNGQRNLYFHVNPPTNHRAGKKLRAIDVASLNYLHVDIDPSPGEAADVAFRSRALGLLTSQRPESLPEPTAVVFSGGGFQAFWRLEAPLLLDGSKGAAESAKLYNVRIEQLLGGDHCHNIDRLMRLPGTWNVPSELKKKKGREKVEAKLVSFEESNAYALSIFQKADSQSALPAGSATTAGAGTDDPEIGTYPKLDSLDDLDRWKVPSRVKTVLAQGRDLDNPKKGDDSRSAWLYDAVCQLIRFGVPDAAIYSVCTDPGWKISESVLDKGSRADAYIRRQIEKAHGKAKTGEHAPSAADAGNDSGGGNHHGNTGGNGGGNGSGVGGSGGSAASFSDFQRDKNNVPFPSQHNVIVALNKLGAQLSYDLFADCMNINGLPGIGPVLQDADIARLYLEIDALYKFRVAKELFWMIVEDQARRNSSHPVRDYLDSLRWDGVPRLDQWIIQYAGAPDTPYVRAVSRLILMAGVRRVRQPGCKFDEMVVFISTIQGKNKSTALANLCPDKSWFTDDLPLGSDSKTIMERLAGKWIVEAAELKGMRNSDVEHLKAFLSRAKEKARMAWGRIARETPRQCIMFGTTNALRFLRDTTGNRRFWPIEIQWLDADAILRWRDQLWAEAAHYEAQGESIRLDQSLWGEAHEVQEQHRLDDPYHDILAEVLGELEGIITSNDVWVILGVAPERRSTQSQQMGEAMRMLGFERKQKAFKNNRKESCYARGNPAKQIHARRNVNGSVYVEYDEGGKYPAEDRQF